ncbi:s-methyl-5-thioribose-1-phosphate isomerase [Geodermatophilus marinus]|nr:s-methyl-5-thioribose-1-phosphate isomerase [Geodermatophilus sp. LHW52908]
MRPGAENVGKASSASGGGEVPVPTLVARSVLVEDDAVRILDRRVFPFERTWVTCRDVEDVARAIEDMVTQSLGPWFAAAGGMVLAARAADRLPAAAARRDHLAAAAGRLVATRPTNNGIRDVVAGLLAAAEPALADGAPVGPAVERAAREAGDRVRAGHRRLGEHAAALVPDGATLLTHCWAETYLTETVAAALRAGKHLDAVCTETRPYLQGARLTAESLAEMGVPTRLITDGMAAHLMSRGDVGVFVTGADRVAMDGSVVNKVGTLQIAVAAHAFGVPYLALVQAPDPQAATAADVELEDRDGAEVLHCLGRRTGSARATGVYPAFDVTPPRFVSVVVTDRGRFAPADVASYWSA